MGTSKGRTRTGIVVKLPRGVKDRTPIPNFSADAPPADWEGQHAQAERMIFERATAIYPCDSRATAGYDNRPTPRLASHHYHQPPRDTVTVYFP